MNINKNRNSWRDKKIKRSLILTLKVGNAVGVNSESF